jgi:acyl-CoA synthetase (AMP-forming)/AMP-acid ligase II
MGTDNSTPRVLEITAEKWPDAEGIVDGDVRLTFQELRDLIARAGWAAKAAGVSKGDRAAIWAPNSWEWIVAALGVQTAKVPRRVAIVEALPLNAVGKVLKPELRNAARSFYSKPRTNTEAR